MDDGWKEPVFLVELSSHGNPELARRLIAENERRPALEALRAFGEAIAMVARARLVERVTAGDRVIAELGDGRAFELWPCGETLYVSGWGCDGPVELRRFRGDFEDNAAEAVAALIEECER